MEHFSAPHDGQNPYAAQLTEQGNSPDASTNTSMSDQCAGGTGLCKLIRTGSVELVEAGSPSMRPRITKENGGGNRSPEYPDSTSAVAVRSTNTSGLRTSTCPDTVGVQKPAMGLLMAGPLTE